MVMYLKQIKLSFMSEFVYKSNTYLLLFTNIISFYIRLTIWQTIYSENVNFSVSLDEMITFIIVGLLIRGLTGKTIARDFAAQIVSGAVERYFTKPLNLKHYLLSEKLGRNLFTTCFNVLPVLIFATIWFRGIVVDITFLPLFILSLVLSILLMFQIDYALSLFTFWLKNGVHIDFLLSALFAVFAGSVIPLWFYPTALRNVALFLPFRLVFFEPIEIFMGRMSQLDAIGIITLQIVWIIIMSLISKLIWNKAQKVIDIQGG